MTQADPAVLRRKLTVIVENLQTSAGLRNRLVHEYEAIVDALVLDAVRKAEDLFPRYVAAIEAYLRT